MADTLRHESIRGTAADIRARAITLRDAVAASYFKNRLDVAIRDLDEVETVLLPQARKATSRDHESLWLHLAALQIRCANDAITAVQQAVDKFGYAAQVVPDDN